EWTGDEHLAHHAPRIEAAAQARESFQLGKETRADVTGIATQRGDRQDESDRRDAAADGPESHVATISDVQLPHPVHAGDIRHVRGECNAARSGAPGQTEPARDER